jgi:hypothetical protein|tara:strand:- start:5405 stop:5929 length:525 start_codon:yes stop_codon:yes gene_type:complete
MKYKNKDLVTIIKIQERTIKATAASARSYKKELKMLGKLYKKAFHAWLDEMDSNCALRRDIEETWDERNKAVYDYNAIYRLAKLSRVTRMPEYEDYELPDGSSISDYTLDIEGKLLESGRITPIAHLIKIPEDTDVAWHTKYRDKSYSFKDLTKKKKKHRKSKYGNLFKRRNES